MSKLDRFKLPRALSLGISIVGIVVIVMFIILVAIALHEKNAVDIEKCAILIENTQGVVDALKIFNVQYDAEVNSKTPDVNILNELNQKRLEGAEIVNTQKKFMDKYNCW